MVTALASKHVIGWGGLCLTKHICFSDFYKSKCCGRYFGIKMFLGSRYDAAHVHYIRQIKIVTFYSFLQIKFLGFQVMKDRIFLWI